MDRLTFAFAASIMIASAAFAAAPWRAMHSLTAEGYSDATGAALPGLNDRTGGRLRSDDGRQDNMASVKMAGDIQPATGR